MAIEEAVWARNQAKIYTDTAIGLLPKSINWKGSVNYFSDLPSTPSEGDAYTVRYSGTSGTNLSGIEYAWGKDQNTNTYEWVKLGSVDAVNGKVGAVTLDAGDLEFDNNIDYAQNTVGEAIKSKVSKVQGKQLSTEDFTTSEKTKLNGIATGAEVNVQSDWNQTNTTSDDFIKNKPSIPTKTSELTNDSGYLTSHQSLAAYRTSTQQDVVDNAQNGEIGKLAENLASAYNASNSYAIGELCVYGNKLYKCNTTISSGETWTVAHWTETTVDEEFNKNCNLVITCLTQDNVTVTGQTVTVRSGSENGGIFTTVAYSGQPITVVVPRGFAYYVSVSDTLASHFNPTTSTGIANSFIKNITLTYSDFSNIKSFTDIKAALNSNINLTELVGEQVILVRNNVEIPFDVVDYDSSLKRVGLCASNTLPTQMVFEPAQALAWFENGLAAGNYYFTNGGTNYYFTLTNAIPNDGQLKGNTTSMSSYSSASSGTAIETVSVSTTEISGATSIGTVAQGNLNHMDRVSYGSNNFGESALFAWLNSNAEPNTNIERVNKFSRPYSSGTDGGFLRGISTEDLAVIDTTQWVVTANNVYEAPASLGGIAVKGQTYTVNGKIGLPSTVDIGLSGTNPWDLYVGATNADRIKRYGGSARYWWLSPPYSSYAYYEYYVYTSGSSGIRHAINSNGVAAALYISADQNN